VIVHFLILMELLILAGKLSLYNSVILFSV